VTVVSAENEEQASVDGLAWMKYQERWSLPFGISLASWPPVVVGTILTLRARSCNAAGARILRILLPDARFVVAHQGKRSSWAPPVTIRHDKNAEVAAKSPLPCRFGNSGWL
jgi:hypothetical protein